MATKRPAPPPLAYVLRTATMRTEYKGAHAEGLEFLFVALPDALARRKMIDRLEKAHAKLLARESTGDDGADVDQQTAAQVAALAHQVHPSMARPPIPVQAGVVRHAPPRAVAPNECAANMNGHRFGPHGPNKEEQCEWCGEARK